MRTVSPLKPERVAEVSQALGPGSQTVCLLWKQVLHPNLFTDQLQIPNPSFATLSRLCTKLEQGAGVRVWVEGSGRYRLVCWTEMGRTHSRAEQSGQERKVVKAGREKVGVRTGEKW